MRVILIIVAAALMATAAAAQQLLLPAPSTPQPTTQGMATRPQAPIGHRQPKMSDLPPDLANKERSGQALGQDPIDDDHLKICRGC